MSVQMCSVIWLHVLHTEVELKERLIYLPFKGRRLFGSALDNVPNALVFRMCACLNAGDL